MVEALDVVGNGGQSREAYRLPADIFSPFPFDVVLDGIGTLRYLSTKFDPAEMACVLDDLLAEQ